jgi:hypothetical protein
MANTNETNQTLEKRCQTRMEFLEEEGAKRKDNLGAYIGLMASFLNTFGFGAVYHAEKEIDEAKSHGREPGRYAYDLVHSHAMAFEFCFIYSKLESAARVYNKYLENLHNKNHQQNITLLKEAVISRDMKEFGQLLCDSCLRAGQKEDYEEYQRLYGGHGDPWGWTGPDADPMKKHFKNMRPWFSEEAVKKYLREEVGLMEI